VIVELIIVIVRYIQYLVTKLQQMELSLRQVLVYDLPPNVTKDDLELLFESRRFCLDGGEVECVEVDENRLTAVVTLEDESGM